LGQDLDAEDATQIVRKLAVHPHCGCHMCIIVELFKPEKAASVIWDDINQTIEIGCLNIIYFKLIAHKCCAHLQILSLETHPHTHPTLLNITNKRVNAQVFSLKKIVCRSFQ
jgi:predicted HAD superfamily hydrolase